MKKIVALIIIREGIPEEQLETKARKSRVVNRKPGFEWNFFRKLRFKDV